MLAFLQQAGRDDVGKSEVYLEPAENAAIIGVPSALDILLLVYCYQLAFLRMRCVSCMFRTKRIIGELFKNRLKKLFDYARFCLTGWRICSRTGNRLLSLDLLDPEPSNMIDFPSMCTPITDFG
jgi:hypothetical protein